MDGAAVVILFILLLVIAGVIAFFIKDYMDYKTLTNNEVTITTNALNTEKTERLSNLKFVVDQINSVNTDIAYAVSSNINVGGNTLPQVDKIQQQLLGGLNTAVAFSTTDGKAVSLLNLPGSKAPDMSLLRHVTAVNGMTINDLNNGNDPNRQMKMCFDPNNCIQLPDKNGNLYLTAPKGTNQGKIQMDAPTMFSQPAILKDKFNITDANNNIAASMYSMPNASSSSSPFMRVKTSGTSFGSQEVTPSAIVHITTDGTTAPLRVQISNPSSPTPKDCFLVDSTGNVTLTGNLTVNGAITTTSPVNVNSPVMSTVALSTGPVPTIAPTMPTTTTTASPTTTSTVPTTTTTSTSTITAPTTPTATSTTIAPIIAPTTTTTSPFANYYY